MSRSTSSQSQQLLGRLEGRDCPACTDGKLARAEYKGNEAVVCEECGTPRAQVWGRMR